MDPTNEAVNVSTTTLVVFVFSETMDVTNSGAVFFDESADGSSVPVIMDWSDDDTVLTCTPDPAFPPVSGIIWVVDAHNTNGQVLNVPVEGFFVTETTNGVGSGTNPYTSFELGAIQSYDQSSTAAAVPDPINPYQFLAGVILASNRTASSVTLELPGGSVSNLAPSLLNPGVFVFGNDETNESVFDSLFGNGSYLFTVGAPGSTQQVTVVLPSSLAQPAAPHVANYAAAQSVDASQPFTLQWDAFAGATGQGFVYVTVGQVYASPAVDSPNPLPAPATSVQIPAGTLQPGSSYKATVGFFDLISATNDNSYTTAAAREAITTFPLNTVSAASSPLFLGNVSFSSGSFGFDLVTSSNLTLTIQYSTNLGPSSGPWQTLFSTNAGPGVIPVSIPVSPANKSVFYRVAVGP